MARMFHAVNAWHGQGQSGLASLHRGCGEQPDHGLSRGVDTAYMSSRWFSDACARTLRAGSPNADTWMRSAPARLIELADAHGIEAGSPLLGGHTGAVCTGVRDGQPVVCKLTLDTAFALREVHSLQALSNSGRVPDVVAAEVHEGFLVTSRVLPGTADLVGDLSAVADLARRLHDVTPPVGATTVEALLADREEAVARHCQTLGLDPSLLCVALEPLDLGAAHLVLCHGDFGPANLLDGPAGELWAIDPECVVGPAAFDLAGYAIRHGSGTAIAVLDELADRYGASQTEARAWLGWMAFDEAVSHTVYGLPIARAEWALAAQLGVLPARS
jgi:hypothetical protein